jgi:hypothetical protein
LRTVFCRGQYFFAVACNLCNVNAIFAMSMRSLQHHKDRCNIAHKRLNLTKNLYNRPIDCVIPSLVTQLNKDVGDCDARDRLLDVVSDLREHLMGGLGINLSESVELQYLHYLAGTSHNDREIRDVIDASSNNGWHQWNKVEGRGGNGKDGNDDKDDKDGGFWSSMLHHLI